MSDKAVNGGQGGGQIMQMMRTVIVGQTSQRFVYTLSNGKYLGSIEFDVSSLDMARAIANDFAAYVAQNTNGVQLVPGDALAKLPRPVS